MLNYNDLKPGVIFVFEGQPWQVLEYEFIRLQQRKPVARTKIKNLVTGKIIERAFHQQETLEEAEIEKAPLKYLYNHKNEFWFCEPQNPANRLMLKEDILGQKTQFLKSNSEVIAYKFNDKVINIELPIKMSFKVVQAPPSIKGNTAQGGTKQVVIETGAKINAPLFIEEGETIVVNTETGEYAGRPR